MSSIIEELTAQRESLSEQLIECKEQLKQREQEYKTTCQLHRVQSRESLELQDQLNAEKEKRKQLTTLLSQQIEMYEEQRRRMHSHIQQLKGNIRVFCRVKPLDSKPSSIAFPESAAGKKPLTVLEIGREKTMYMFDCVFPPKCSQEEVFKEVAPFLQSALDGENVCIFAYGQTGSGKTYTMEGAINDEYLLQGKLTATSGILPRAAHYIFGQTSQLASKGFTFAIFFSALEIHNEDLKDLLAKQSSLTFVSRKTSSELRGLAEKEVRSLEELVDWVKFVGKERRVERTSMNERSSRSHLVYRLKIVGENGSKSRKFVGRLNVVDLAGSERAVNDPIVSKDEALLREAKNINKSLTTLGRVLTMLSDRKSSKRASIPYRESKLTRVLQSSLQFESKTLMFVNICPSMENTVQSKESLRFAATASLAC
eukprot:TRINITY_DN14363_c0_g2_i1.p1 TRINITY_DN14363_c0_g2~~TRINITY_DN14363_c0_g2_i1.p1  ORF type:complete len:427 (+),score=95.72 TRINITY_DN14363_c0_g2_i1:447-1727(+)